MQKFRLRADALEVDTFQVGAPSRWGGAAVLDERDRPPGAENTGHDHCTPSEALPTCATCDEAYDTCAETCDASCYPCWTGPKPICLDG
ncbi:MAG TPA: hypothetical protein VFS20_21570 [Longimicrobium sp.]|nr:hypothetical protein [Longimicrobium sp.]